MLLECVERAGQEVALLVAHHHQRFAHRLTEACSLESRVERRELGAIHRLAQHLQSVAQVPTARDQVPYRFLHGFQLHALFREAAAGRALLAVRARCRGLGCFERGQEARCLHGRDGARPRFGISHGALPSVEGRLLRNSFSASLRSSIGMSMPSTSMPVSLEGQKPTRWAYKPESATACPSSSHKTSSPLGSPSRSTATTSPPTSAICAESQGTLVRRGNGKIQRATLAGRNASSPPCCTSSPARWAIGSRSPAPHQA